MIFTITTKKVQRSLQLYGNHSTARQTSVQSISMSICKNSSPSGQRILHEINLLVLKNVSLVRANDKNRTAHGKNKNGGVRKTPRSSLYSGTCFKMIFSYIGSLLVYLCMLMIIKYTPMIMMYRRPPKLIRRQTGGVTVVPGEITASQPSKILDSSHRSKKTPRYA